MTRANISLTHTASALVLIRAWCLKAIEQRAGYRGAVERACFLAAQTLQNAGVQVPAKYEIVEDQGIQFGGKA